MDKIIVMVRTSTEKQSSEDQHKEMEDFCISEGWSADSIVWIEEEGASASKVDDTYRAMIDKVKVKVEEDPEIKCFAVWHLNRLARTEEVWIEIKSFFVSRKIQIISRTPYLKLLTPTGEVDPGMELAMGLLAILSKQDQAERKEKFRRAKTSMAKKGQYLGGHTKPYGYKVVDKAFVEDEEEGKVVRAIFELYSTGEYSSRTLQEELGNRGIIIGHRQIVRILCNKSVTGEVVSDSGMHYPQIISKELWDKCAEVRQSNFKDLKRGDRIVLGAKLVRCPDCGSACTSNSHHYICNKASHHRGCDNTFGLRQDVVDSLLSRVAEHIHMEYLMNMSETEVEEYRGTIEVLEQKLQVQKDKLAQTQAKKDRVVESYMDGLIDREKRDLRLANVEDEARSHRDAISSLQERIDAILGIIENHNTDINSEFNSALDELELADRFQIIHRHIKSLVGKRVSYGERDKRTKRPNAVEITITDVTGGTWKYMYFPKYYKGHNLYAWNGRRWVADRLDK